MTTRIPVTIEGNFTADPEHDTSGTGVEYAARFSVAVNDRRLTSRFGGGAMRSSAMLPVNADSCIVGQWTETGLWRGFRP